MPGFPSSYAVSRPDNRQEAPPSNNMAVPASQGGTFFSPDAAIGFGQYGQSQQSHMGPSMMDGTPMVPEFNNQVVGTSTHFQSTPSQQTSPTQELTNTLDQTPSISVAGNPPFDAPPYFDPNDPALFNFNISELNFGNHYGALEFGMLGHISSGAINTPELDGMNSMSHANQTSVSYDGTGSYPTAFNSGNQQNFSWQNAPNTDSRQNNSTSNIWTPQGYGTDAYAIGEQASSLTGASPHSQGQDFAGYQSASMSSPETQFAQPEQTQQPDLLRQSFSQAQQLARKQAPFPGESYSDPSRNKRRRDTVDVYTSVTAPYSYTTGFHALTAFLQRRFPSNKVVRIAKALATIRPSFISCNQKLCQDDLIFMEKCFQRTLYEYENFVNYYGTPTIICRRTGEIAAVSKEFCLITSWKRDVLLGKEPNLNVNTGNRDSGSQTGTSSKGAVTPRVSNLGVDPGRPQPVFLAELLDEDSVVQFYEDFAEVAFGAPRNWRGGACSLLKYRTKEDPGWAASDELANDGKRVKKIGEIKTEPAARGDSGSAILGEKDGRVDCQMCWTVKRDVFDIPMLIVINVSPSKTRAQTHGMS